MKAGSTVGARRCEICAAVRPGATTTAATRRIAPGVHGRVLALVVPGRFVVEEVDEAAMTWTWRVHVGPVTMRLHHTVEPGERGEGCRTTLHIQAPPGLGAAYAPVAWFALTRLVATP